MESTASLLEQLVVETSAVTGQQYFNALTRALGQSLGVKYVYVTGLVSEADNEERLRVYSCWSAGEPVSCEEYSSKATPCMRVLEENEYFCGSNVASEFPEDAYLAALEAESYYGVAYHSCEGELLGIICLLNDQPMTLTDEMRTVMRVHADRTGLELERQRNHERERFAKELIKDHNAALSLIAAGEPLPEVLEQLVRYIERRAVGMKASVLLLEGDRLYQGAAPSLDEEYNRLVDGVPIGPNAGSCGTAAYTGDMVIVEDIASDPKWEGIRETAARHNLRSCWSKPILSRSGDVLGTFALYYHEPRKPCESDLELIEAYAQIAAVAIEHKRVEDALKQRDAELAHMSRLSMLGEAVAEIAHEMNQPLYTIANFAGACTTELAKPNGGDRSDVTAWLERIRSACDRASDVLQRVTRFFRRRQLEQTPVDVDQLIQETLGLISWKTGRMGIELTHTPADRPLEVMADRVLIEQVLLNLITNACDALDSPPHHVPKRIKVYAQSTAKTARITVEDNGPGVSQELQENLFGAFITDKSNGLGMGLAICKSIVDEHQGRIRFENSPTSGARFVVELPLVAPGKTT